MSLTANLEKVRAKIHAACVRAGRDPNSVRLLAVTKTVGASVIEELARLGITDVGENRVQTLVEKFPQVQAPLRWHFIGPLQRNKARKALELCSAIHSVDSLKLLEAIDRLSGEMHKITPIFLEIHVSGEASKQGFSPQQALEAAQMAAKLPHLQLEGLMTMAPMAKDPEKVRPFFRQLRELRDKLEAAKVFRNGGQLSMGMSQDYEVAIEEGADWVRVGSALYADSKN